MTELTQSIRPSARLIRTIGEDLIGDPNAALIELVKNSYDADASKVDIVFEYKEQDNEEVLSIKVVDNGHGMSSQTVVDKWLVPATDDKLKRKESQSGSRMLQGRKGIGRFASAILGDDLTLISSVEDEQTTIILDWNEFSSDKFLSDIEFLVDIEKGKYSTGTNIEVIAKSISITEDKDEDEDDKKTYWSVQILENLINELRKLVTPFDDFEDDTFKISLKVINPPFKFESEEIYVERYPIIDFYDYRIYGTIDKYGQAELTYENAVDINTHQTQTVTKNIILDEGEKYSGEVVVDLRVFDRETEAFENLIEKGLINPISKQKIGKLEARRELNNVYGVNIYKNRFRISPYGNQGVDWLKLDNRRIQNPSMRISNNQIVGFVTIQSEELSGLNEKSARDGLKDNANFKGLKHILEEVIRELELKRYSYRKKAGKGRNKKEPINVQIDDLFDFGVFKNLLKDKVEEEVDEQTYKDVLDFIDKQERTKTKLLEDIKRQIAVYQGQATLGRIVSVVLHEGRKPLQYFQDESRNLKDSFEIYELSNSKDVLEGINHIIDGFKRNAKNLSDLYTKITPLASKRPNRKNFSILDALNESLEIFRGEIKRSNVSVNIDIDPSINAYGWKVDLEIAFSNLIENSIYWLNHSETVDKIIQVEARLLNDDEFLITYKDNGPGIKEDYIISGDVFSPGFTTKDTDNATGLGLAIAGESIERLNGKLLAIEDDQGAYFEIKIKVGKSDK